MNEQLENDNMCQNQIHRIENYFGTALNFYYVCGT